MDRGQVIQGFRLSPQQRRIWLLLQQGSRAYRAQCVILIEGVLDKAALKNGIRMTVERHEILRTTFTTAPGPGPSFDQPSGVFPIQVVNSENLSGGSGDLKEFDGDESRIEEILVQLRQSAGEPDNGPVLRTLLLTVSETKYFLFLDLPALCADRAALRNLLHELVQSYEACVEGTMLPDERLQYADISEWQNELLEADDTELGRTYWRKQNFVISPETRLPYDRQSPRKGGFATQVIAAPVDAVLLQRLETLVATCEVPLPVVLLGAWRVLLWRLTGDAHVLVGTAHDGRKYDETRSALGLLTKYLPVQQELSATITFSHVVQQLDDLLGELWKFQEYFSWEGRAAITPSGETVPLLPFLFSFEQHTAKLKVRDASFSLYKEYVCLDQFGVELLCNRTEEALNLEFHYDVRCFNLQNVERLAAQFNELLQSVTENAGTAITDLNILTTTERRRLLQDFNRTAAVYPSDQTVHQLFERQAARTPHNPAVFCAGRQLTFAELNKRANHLAHSLRESGIGPETCIGIFMERSVEMIVGLLGILKAGGAYVALNPDYPSARLLKQLEEIQTPVLLTQVKMRDRLPDFDAELICLDLNEELGQNEDEDNLKWTGTPEQAAYVMYTSGSTGSPKGVVVSHRNLMNYTHDICERLGVSHATADGYLNFATVSTLSADLGNTCIFPSLVSGGCLHIIPYDVATDAKLFADYAARHPFDVLKIVPSHLRHLLSTVEGSGILPRRFLITGGEALNIELVEQINRIGAGCRLINHYGPTETTIGSAVNSELATTLESGIDNGRPAGVPIGRAIANTSLYVLDEKWRVVPIGVAGELYIGGAGVARGYLRQAAETAAKFLPDPYRGESGARMYRTGDRARFLDDGSIEFLGRIDDQVKIRGYRVEPGEIEAALLQHPRVSQAAVIGRCDVSSLSSMRLLAYVVPSHSTNGEGDAPSVADLRQHLDNLLPDYMVPHSIVKLPQLPLTPNGKLDRRALPDPDLSITSEVADSRPRTAAEETLTSIWSEVLGVRRLSLHDNFFELGGDSIVSIQIVSRAKQAGLHLTPRLLFDHPTISELAAVADQQQPEILAEQGTVSGNIVLTPIGHRFIEQELIEPHHFNQTVLLQLRRPFAPPLVATALAHLVAHHDALRLRLRHSERAWELWNEAEESNDYFTTVDLSRLTAAEQSAVIERESGKWQASLDLAEGPMLRVVYFDCGPQRSARLLWVIHHLCVDGVSWRILLEDLQRSCEQLAAGQKVSLEEKTTSFQQWAEQLEIYAETERVRAQLSYWTDQGRQGLPALPVDKDGENRMESVGNVSVDLNAEETSWLLQEVGEAYGTRVEEVLLTALAEAIRRWSGADRIMVDMEGHGREEISANVDVSRTVGWFTTHYPLMLEIGNHVDAGAALKLVKEQVRSVPERGLGYGLLRYMTKDAEVRELMRALPQPEMSFNYLGQFDQSVGESSIFGMTPESSGPSRSPRHKRIVKLTVNASVVGGQLQVTWTYSESLHERATIEQVAHDYLDALRRLIEHCRSPEAGGFTPSDFPEADLTQEELDRLVAKFG